MKIAMSERRVLTKNHAKEYQRSKKNEKSRLLEMFVKATGYNRVYASRLLRRHGCRIRLRGGVVVEGDVRCRPKRVRGREYGPEVEEVVKRLWEYLDYLCGKRLVEALPGALESLESHGELKVGGETRRKVLEVSASTLDRLLAEERERLALRKRGGTKPGTLLKSQIAVRTFAEWTEGQAGFVEIDLVAHDGGSSAGEYLQTLDVTDVYSGWSEQVAVLNKAQRWVFEALQEVRARLPFPLWGVDSDNGGEFINAPLVSYCQAEGITFTRSRPYRKNDTCFVEQKNYSIVRRTVGYGRFVGPKAVKELNLLYGWLRLRTNFFLPSMKLLEKRRRGSRVSKRHDRPKTPYQRLLESPNLPEPIKETLRRQFRSLNLAQLDREIRKAQARLGKRVRQVAPGQPQRRPSASPKWWDKPETVGVPG